MPCGETDQDQDLLDAILRFAFKVNSKVASVLRGPFKASSRLLKTLSFSNTVGFWNFRPMPRLAMAASSRRVRSIRVEQHVACIGAGLAGDDVHHGGFSGAVGPITVRNSPGSMTSDRLFKALKPSKLTVTPSR